MKTILVVLAAAALSGCIVAPIEPAHGYYHGHRGHQPHHRDQHYRHRR